MFLWTVFRKPDRQWNGLNLKTPDTSLDPSESPNLQDIEFSNLRDWEKRLGATRYNPISLPRVSAFFAGSTLCRIEVPHNSAYDFGTFFTIEFAFQWPDGVVDSSGNFVPLGGTRSALSKSTAWNATYDGTAGANAMQFAFLEPGASVARVVTPSTIGFHPRQNYFLSVTRSSTLLSLYLDGTLVATATCTTAPFVTNGSVFTIGAYGGNEPPTGQFNGRVSEVRFWSVARTSGQIQLNANRELFQDERTSDLIGYWPLSAGGGTKAIDLTATGNHGYFRPAPPEWVQGLILDHALAVGDYALRGDGQATYVRIAEENPQLLTAVRSSFNWSVQFRTTLTHTGSSQYLYTHGLNHNLFSGYNYPPAALELYLSSGSLLCAEVGGYAGSNRTSTVVTNPLIVQPGVIYNVMCTRQSSTILLAVGTGGSGSYVRQTASHTFDPARLTEAFPIVLLARTTQFDANTAPPTGADTGRAFGGGSGFAAATIDELRLWSRNVDLSNASNIGAFSPTITQDSIIPDPMALEDLLAYFKFDEGTGTQTNDGSGSGFIGELLPVNEGPRWETGITRPLVGPPVLGSVYYQRVGVPVSPGAFADRVAVVQAGIDLLQIQNGEWKSLRTTLTSGYRSTMDVHRNLLLWGNGLDRNLKWDGQRVEFNGIERPTATPTVALVGTTGLLAHGVSGIMGGPSLVTAFCTNRTEAVSFWNGATIRFNDPAQPNYQAAQPTEDRVVAFYTPPTAQNTAPSPSGGQGMTWDIYTTTRVGLPGGTTRLIMRNARGIFPSTPQQPNPLSTIPTLLMTQTAFMEGFYLQTMDTAFTTVSYLTRIVQSTPFSFGPAAPPGILFSDITISPALAFPVGGAAARCVLTSTLAALCLFSNGVALPSALATFSNFNYSYTFPTVGLGLNGVNRWRYSFYNPRTDTESDLSEPTEYFTTSGGNAVRIANLLNSSDPQVTAKRLYRTITAANSNEVAEEYFLVKQIDNNVELQTEDRAFDTELGLEPFDLLEHGVVAPAFLVKVFRDRAFYVPKNEPNTVYVSKAGHPEYTNPVATVDFDIGDGDEITALASVGDTFLVFKRASVKTIVGLDSEDLSNMRGVELDASTGCVGQGTVVETENMVIFTSDRGVFSYDGQEFQYLSESIEPVFKLALEQGRLKYAVAGHRRRYNSYVLSLPLWGVALGFGTTPNLENDLCFALDYVTGKWTQWSRKASDYLRYFSPDGRDVALYADYHGFLYTMDTVNYNEIGDALVHTNTRLIGTVASIQSTRKFTASGSPGFPVNGDGYKGLRILFYDEDGALQGSDVITETQGDFVRLLSGLTLQVGWTWHIAPIPAFYETGHMDIEVPEFPKRLEFVHTDHGFQGAQNPVTCKLYTDRQATPADQREIRQDQIVTRTPMRGRGYFLKLRFEQFAPNQTFDMRNLSLEGEIERVR